MSFLRDLRDKPSHIKTRYAFLFALFLTGAIGAVWTTTLPARFASIREASMGMKDDTASVGQSVDDLMDGIEGLTLERETKGTKENDAPTPQGALGALQNWQATSTEPASSHTLKQAKPVPSSTDSVVPQHDAIPSTATATPKQAVILIGTTTTNTKNAE